ncbi:alpha/beta fold hydrolase [Arthrobacter sp. D3-16]
MDSDVRLLNLRTGVRVPCLLHGGPTATPLLLLHAWGESRRSFDRLIPLLANYRIAAPDLRGQGEADKPASGYSLQEQAEDVAAILDALHLSSASILGSSSGGYIAQQLAVSHPERVDTLVLVGAPLTLSRRPAFADEVEALTEPIDEDWVRESLLWFQPGRPVPQWYLDDRVRDGVRMPVHVWKLALAGLYRATPPLDLGAIHVPTLILRGEQDDLLPQADHEVLADRIPGSVLKIYPGVGHVVLWEDPERVAEDTKAFLG